MLTVINIASGIEVVCRYLIEYLTLVRDTGRKDYVESRYAIRGYHDQKIILQRVYVAHLAVIYGFLSRQSEVGTS